MQGKNINLIFKKTDRLFDQYLPSDLLRTILKNRLINLKKSRQFQNWAPCVDIPYHLSLGLNNSIAQSHWLGVLTTLLFLGCDLLDDLHDQDLYKSESPYSPAQLSLASAVLLTALPNLVLRELASVSKNFALLKTISDSLLVMAAGQFQDLSLANPYTIHPNAIEAMVLKKSGEELSLFCRLAAKIASVSPIIEQKCADFGKFLGTALQISSDVFDLFWAPQSKDLKHSSLTLPIALHLVRIKNQAAFLKLLERAGHVKGARAKIKKHLTSSGSIEHTAIFIEFYCEKARQILNGLKFGRKVQRSLEKLINKISLQE
ncbi:MAG: polyprenyl synthetase family protein [Deltaproteobacteria bacterium]|nr:polyprenyl synthetase family protein [Deltaproteobacteria bacterium]